MSEPLSVYCPTSHCVYANGEHLFKRMYSGALGYEPDEAQAYDQWRAEHGNRGPIFISSGKAGELVR